MTFADITIVGAVVVFTILLLKLSSRSWLHTLVFVAAGLIGAVLAGVIARATIDQFQPSGDVDVFAPIEWGLVSLVGFLVGLGLASVLVGWKSRRGRSQRALR